MRRGDLGRDWYSEVGIVAALVLIVGVIME